MSVYFASKIQNIKKNKSKNEMMLFRSVTAIRTVAEWKNNFRILGLLYEDLTTREKKYHYSYYLDITRSNYTEKEKKIPKSSKDQNVYKEFELQAFQEIFKY